MSTEPVWRYLSRGKVKHALKPSPDPYLFGVTSWCNIRPYTATLWLGTMSHEQRVRLGRLQQCAHCTKRIREKSDMEMKKGQN